MNFVKNNKIFILLIIVWLSLIIATASSRKQRVESRDTILKSNDSLKIELQKNTKQLEEVLKHYEK